MHTYTHTPPYKQENINFKGGDKKSWKKPDHTVILVLRGQRQEDGKFKASWGYTDALGHQEPPNETNCLKNKIRTWPRGLLCLNCPESTLTQRPGRLT